MPMRRLHGAHLSPPMHDAFFRASFTARRFCELTANCLPTVGLNVSQAGEKRERIVETTASEVDRQTALVEQALTDARKQRNLAASAASSSGSSQQPRAGEEQPPRPDHASDAATEAAEAAAKNARLAAFVGSVTEGQQALGTVKTGPPQESGQ